MTTTGWLLLLLMVVSSHSQSTTDDERCGDGWLLRKLEREVERLLDNQQQLFEHHQTILDRIRK